MNKYLKFSRYLLGACSVLLFLIGILFTIFMPPLLIFYPLFIYLIYLNFRNSNRMLDQFDLIQICIWFIVFLPSGYFIFINLIFILFILFKLFKKQLVNSILMIGFSIVFLITRDKISIIILISLCIFSILHDFWLKHKISQIP